MVDIHQRLCDDTSENVLGRRPSAPPNYFRATSKVDSEHIFLTYSQKSGAYVDSLRRGHRPHSSCERAKKSQTILGNIKSRYLVHIPNIFSKTRG